MVRSQVRRSGGEMENALRWRPDGFHKSSANAKPPSEHPSCMHLSRPELLTPVAAIEPLGEC